MTATSVDCMYTFKQQRHACRKKSLLQASDSKVMVRVAQFAFTYRSGNVWATNYNNIIIATRKLINFRTF